MKLIHLLTAVAMTTALPSLRAAEPAVQPYPLTTCVISGEKLGEMGKPVVVVYEGQEVKLCCGGCKAQFEKDPAAVVKKINAAVNSKSSGGAN